MLDLRARSACVVLGLDPDRGMPSLEEIKGAARRAFRRAHPDSGGDGDVGGVRAARDMLLGQHMRVVLGKCSTCGGTGIVKGLRPEPCHCVTRRRTNVRSA